MYQGGQLLVDPQRLESHRGKARAGKGDVERAVTRAAVSGVFLLDGVFAERREWLPERESVS